MVQKPSCKPKQLRKDKVLTLHTFDQALNEVAGIIMYMRRPSELANSNCALTTTHVQPLAPKYSAQGCMRQRLNFPIPVLPHTKLRRTS